MATSSRIKTCLIEFISIGSE